MMLAHRHPRTTAPALPRLSFGALRFDLPSRTVLVLVIVASAALAVLTANRMVRIERDLQPALEDSRRLGATLDATRALLRDGGLGDAELRIARADSSAQRFHALATRPRAGAEQAALMRAHDHIFGAWYVAARRAAQGRSMSADADGSSAEDAALGYTMLRENLAAGVGAQERALDAARPATAPVELTGWLALALVGAAALVRRTRMEREAAERVAARGLAYVPVPADDGPATPPALRLRDAMERMARQRLAASVAAARVAKRNNERQVEVSRTWSAPTLTVVPGTRPVAEMSVYEDGPGESPRYGALSLVSM